MKAAYLRIIGGPESLVLDKILQTQPKAGEALVKLHATYLMTDLESARHIGRRFAAV
jgi:hypothetical protein